MIEDKKPRYTKNIYLSHIKHLTRTLNTLIVYECVKRIFIKFSKSKNKYQLFLDINHTVEEIDYSDKLIIVYDKSKSDPLLYNEKEILKVLESPLSKEKQQIDVLHNLGQLVKKYTDMNISNSINNTFFREDLELIIDKINTILPSNVITQYKPKNKDTYVKTMVEKKIYFLIKNQLTFFNLNKINSLENEKISKKENIINFVKEEVLSLNENIKYLRESKLPKIFPSDMEIIANKKEIEDAIQYYYDDSVEKYNLSSYTLEELKEQLFLINSKKEQGIYELKSKTFIEKIDFQIGLKVELYFKDFIEFINYCIAKNKEFSTNTISRYLTNIHNQLSLAKKTTGLKRKRKRKIKDLREKYSNIIDMDKDAKFYYITKLAELYNHSHLYSNLSDELDHVLMYINMYIPPFEDIEDLLIGESKETLESIANEKVKEREFEEKADILGISKDEYKFNSFYEVLIEHIEKTMDFQAPITIGEYDEYYSFISDKNKIKNIFEDLYDDTEVNEILVECNQMLEYINEFSTYTIHKKLEDDLLANGYEIDKEPKSSKNKKAPF